MLPLRPTQLAEGLARFRVSQAECFDAALTSTTQQKQTSQWLSARGLREFVQIDRQHILKARCNPILSMSFRPEPASVFADASFDEDHTLLCARCLRDDSFRKGRGGTGQGRAAGDGHLEGELFRMPQ